MIKKRIEKKRIRKGKRELKIIKNETDGKIKVVMKNGNGKDAKKNRKNAR
ncbi:MAG: hypothetical protein NT166_04995 [Candidatus Aminicenantes bacterium]|nr:hypothetical protein [Candidatus Aminicenantes bacterium]